MAVTPIERNARVEATDGELGRVTHVIVDPQTHEVAELVVARDRDQWVISIDAVASVEGDRVLLREARSRFFMISSPFRRDAFQPAGLAATQQAMYDTTIGSAVPRDDVPQGVIGADDEARAPMKHVQIRRVVTERVETLTVTLRSERLLIEVLPEGGPICIDGQVVRPGEVIDLPLMTEHARVVKEIVVGEPDASQGPEQDRR